MSYIPNQRKRRLLPRWRPFEEAVASGELASVKKTPPPMVRGSDEFLEKKLSEWKLEPSIGLAVDILSSAVVLGRSKELEQIGWWVLTRKEEFASAVVDLANVAVKEPTRTPPQDQRTRETIIGLLRKCRSMIGSNPNDSVLYVDMALAHAMLGNLKHAERSIKIATRLAPGNRFVLRSASRFWIHAKRPDRARSLLLKNARTPNDPWLLAAELAVSSLADKSPRFIGQSRVVLHGQSYSPHQISELAGAMGTIEALDGSRSKARNFFRQSMLSPTENAIAQAVWASEENVLPEFSLDKFSHLKPNEAHAWQARATMDWHSAIDACAAWAEDETFSTGPTAMGSFIASVIGEPGITQKLAEQGLKSNPNDFTLRNNLVVALILLGDEIKAMQILSTLSSQAKTPQDLAVSFATLGLAFLYGGEFEEGRVQYRKAIEMALERGERQTAALAAAFWARAEIDLNGDNPNEPLEMFDRHSKMSDEPELRFFRKKLISKSSV